jgi:hypothetical protein
MKGIPLKQLRSEQRAKRRQAAAGLVTGAKNPVATIKVPTVAKRVSVSPPSRRDK